MSVANKRQPAARGSSPAKGQPCRSGVAACVQGCDEDRWMSCIVRAREERWLPLIVGDSAPSESDDSLCSALLGNGKQPPSRTHAMRYAVQRRAHSHRPRAREPPASARAIFAARRMTRGAARRSPAARHPRRATQPRAATQRRGARCFLKRQRSAYSRRPAAPQTDTSPTPRRRRARARISHARRAAAAAPAHMRGHFHRSACHSRPSSPCHLLSPQIMPSALFTSATTSVFHYTPTPPLVPKRLVGESLRLIHFPVAERAQSVRQTMKSAFIVPTPSFTAGALHAPLPSTCARSSHRRPPARMTCVPFVPTPNDNSDIPPLPVLAQLELRAGDPAAAARLLSRHLSETPTDARSWIEYAKAARKAHGHKHAAQILQRAVGHVQNDAYVWHFYASCEAAASGKSSARKVYKRALENCPDNAVLLSALAALESSVSNFATAAKLFQRAIEADIQDPYIYMQWANMELRRRNFSKASSVFEMGVRAVRKSKAAPLYTAYAGHEAKRGKFQRARFLYMRAAEADPKDKLVWHAWASLEHRTGNNERARQLFERAIVADPSFPCSWQAWGLLEEREQKFNAARCLYERGTRADPHDPLNWQAWALLEARTGNVTESRRLFREAADRVGEGKAAMLYMNWALLEANVGDTESARTLFMQGMNSRKENSQDVIRLVHVWAGVERKEGNVTKARELYNRALRINSRDYKVLHAFSSLEQDDGNYEASRELLKKSVRFSSGDLMAIRSLAMLEWKHFAEDGGVERARKLFAETTRRRGRHASLLRVWAALEEDQGDSDKAERLRILANKRQ